MAESELFEEMLTTYPAEKRELARAVYHRFAEGDSTQFFSQLFLLLDVYAHYAERIPTRMISANADSLWRRLRKYAEKSRISPRRLKPAMPTSRTMPKRRMRFAAQHRKNAMKPLRPLN